MEGELAFSGRATRLQTPASSEYMFQCDTEREEILTDRILLVWTFEKVLKDNMWEEAEEEETTWNVPQFRKKKLKNQVSMRMLRVRVRGC